jgi:hypothetical protein
VQHLVVPGDVGLSVGGCPPRIPPFGFLTGRKSESFTFALLLTRFADFRFDVAMLFHLLC